MPGTVPASVTSIWRWLEATRGTGSRRAVVRYIAVWLAAGAAMTVGLVALLDASSADQVTLPPVRETRLATAARDARCTLTRAAPGQRLTPAVDGPAGRPATPGVYDEAPPGPSLIGALRHGIVVIHVRPGSAWDDPDLLSHLQGAIPEGTIVTTGDAGLPFEVAATAYRRLLGCPRFTTQALDAVRLFRGRFVGRGPDG